MDGGRRIALFDMAASVVRRIDSTPMAMRMVAARSRANRFSLFRIML
jgi:hypothetical protein